jgi:hypothetical protein
LPADADALAGCDRCGKLKKNKTKIRSPAMATAVASKKNEKKPLVCNVYALVGCDRCDKLKNEKSRSPAMTSQC